MIRRYIPAVGVVALTASALAAGAAAAAPVEQGVVLKFKEQCSWHGKSQDGGALGNRGKGWYCYDRDDREWVHNDPRVVGMAIEWCKGLERERPERTYVVRAEDGMIVCRTR